MGVVRSDAAPATPLAAAQGVWAQVAGETVAAQSEPVAERAGVLTIACHSATWAQELDLMAPDLLGRLNEALVKTGSEPFERLRFTADAARHFRT